MRLSELLERLEEARDELAALGDPHDKDQYDPVVRIASQPSYPLAFGVRGVALQSEIEDEEPEREFGDERDREVLWLVAGDHPESPASPYASRFAWDVAR